MTSRPGASFGIRSMSSESTPTEAAELASQLFVFAGCPQRNANGAVGACVALCWLEPALLNVDRRPPACGRRLAFIAEGHGVDQTIAANAASAETAHVCPLPSGAAADTARPPGRPDRLAREVGEADRCVPDPNTIATAKSPGHSLAEPYRVCGAPGQRVVAIGSPVAQAGE